MATINLTKDNFRKTYEDNNIVIIDFWASWCQPCLGFAPTYEEVSEEYPDITFGKVDTELEPDLSTHFSVRSIPTIMVIRDGIEVFYQPGALSKEDLLELITKVKGLDMADLKKKAAEEDANQD